MLQFEKEFNHVKDTYRRRDLTDKEDDTDDDQDLGQFLGLGSSSSRTVSEIASDCPRQPGLAYQRDESWKDESQDVFVDEHIDEVISKCGVD